MIAEMARRMTELGLGSDCYGNHIVSTGSPTEVAQNLGL